MTTPEPAPSANGNPNPATASPWPDASASPGVGPTGSTPQPGAVPPQPGAVPPPSGSAGNAWAAVPPPAAGSTPPGWSQPSPWPERRESPPSGLVFGIILVVVGALFLALRLGNIALGPDAWPLWLIVPGLAMLGGSLFIPSRSGLGLAVPGVILAIVGDILWVQATYDLYGTWVYAWALVAPTGPGLAMLVHGGVHGDVELARDGLRATLVGLGLFLGFALFFEGVLGISGHRIENLDQVLPYAAIGLGVLLIVLAFVDGGRHDSWRDQRRAERRAAKERRRAERAAQRAAH